MSSNEDMRPVQYHDLPRRRKATDPTHNRKEGGAIKNDNKEALEFAGKIARAMKELKSSHVYFIFQQGYGNVDWRDVEKTLDKVIEQTPGIARDPMEF